MNTKKFLALFLAAVLFAAIAFAGCKDNKTKPVSEDGSAASSESGTNRTGSSEITETTAKAPAKYSSKDKLVALTFDDGPNYKTTNRILDILEKNNSVATFFLVGYNIADNAETISRAHRMGCEIGNHSQDHKILTKCNASTIREQVSGPNESLKALLGASPVLFRAPGGAYKDVEETIGMPLIQWSIDTKDWKFKDAAHKGRSDAERTADLRRIADDVVNKAESGDIVLMHDIYEFTADLCELVIPELVAKGFKLVTVTELFEAYGETLEGGKVYSYAKLPAEATEPFTEVVSIGNYIVKTKGSVLNMRAEANVNASVIAKIANGTAVSVSKSVEGWAFVTHGEYSGWVNAKFLEKVE
ncbi:MAG: polysaccharide deacetylase family protein [Clostridia bacterium]|nr:polysaccharide deacetylase family protein [Clostridia bacterium]